MEEKDNLSPRKTAHLKKVFVLSIIILLVMLFGYTGLSKVLEFDQFIFQLGINPMPMINENKVVIAWLVPSIELMICLMMIFESLRYIALLLSLTLLIIFETYILSMLLSGLDLPCSCGGVMAMMSWKSHLLFNAVFILLCSTALIFIKKH